MSYATVEELEAGFRMLDADEKAAAEALLSEAAVLIDAWAATSATEDAKKVVSCWMVRRAVGAATDGGIQPFGATQGSQSVGSWSQSWTNSNGGFGELYLTKNEKKLLGCGDRIGASNPLSDLIEETE